MIEPCSETHHRILGIWFPFRRPFFGFVSVSGTVLGEKDSLRRGQTRRACRLRAVTHIGSQDDVSVPSTRSAMSMAASRSAMPLHCSSSVSTTSPLRLPRVKPQVRLAPDQLSPAWYAGGQPSRLYLIDSNGGRDRTRTCDLLRVKLRVHSTLLI